MVERRLFAPLRQNALLFFGAGKTHARFVFAEREYFFRLVAVLFQKAADGVCGIGIFLRERRDFIRGTALYPRRTRVETRSESPAAPPFPNFLHNSTALSVII